MTDFECLVVFTAKSVERILREGGTGSWRLVSHRADKCVYAICTRNAHADWVEGKEPHRSAFIVGKIRDVVPSSSKTGRWLVRFSEYARVSVPLVWQGDRNPVRYVSASELKRLGLDFATLKWEPMPKESGAAAKHQSGEPSRRGLTMADARAGLAVTFGVPPEAVEITIHG